MHSTWILVADRSAARLFAKDGHRLRALEAFSNPDGRLKNHEIDSAKPGRSFDSVGHGRHAEEPDHQPTENLANEFAHKLAKVLERGRTEHRYDSLVLVADPKFLGRLRAVIQPDTRRLITDALDKDLSNVSDGDLAAHLSEILNRVALPS